MGKYSNNMSDNYEVILDSTRELSTEEIMDLSLIFLKSARSILECECKHDEMQADWVYNECKRYIEIYKKLEKQRIRAVD